MEDKDLVQDLKERLIRIEMLVESVVDMNSEKLKVVNHRLNDLENQITWQNRAIVGAIIAGAIALLFK